MCPYSGSNCGSGVDVSSCTFFGHRDCLEMIKPKLKEVLIDLITNHGVDMFYVGHQG